MGPIWEAYRDYRPAACTDMSWHALGLWPGAVSRGAYSHSLFESRKSGTTRGEYSLIEPANAAFPKDTKHYAPLVFDLFMIRLRDHGKVDAKT